MTAPSRQYAGVPGFALDDTPTPTPKHAPPDPTRSLRENLDLIQDLCRYAEGLDSESAVRRRWRLPDDVWEKLGDDDELVRAIEEERARRVRNGSFKRERAQAHIIRGPDVLAKIMDNPRANDRHRIDSIKALDQLADPGPEAAVEQERVHIVINLTGDSKLKDPKDILVIDATPRPSTPKQIEEQSDEWRR
jgi:hypothetical protein